MSPIQPVGGEADSTGRVQQANRTGAPGPSVSREPPAAQPIAV